MDKFKNIFLLCLCLFSFFSFGQNIQSFLDTLKAKPKVIVEKKKGSEEKAKAILKKIDTTIKSTAQIDLVLEYYLHHSCNKNEYPHPLLLWAKKTSKKLNYDKGYLNSLMSLGDVKRLTETGEEAIEHYREGYKIDNNNISFISRIALVHMGHGEYKKSIKSFLELLEINKKQNDKKALMVNYHNIGDVFLHALDTINGLKYLQLSNELEKQSPSLSIRAMNTSFIGQIYLNQKRYAIAKENLKASNKLIKNHGVVPYLQVYNLIDLGIISEKENDLVNAKKYYKKALAVTYNRNTFEHTVIAVTKLANILIKENKYKDALIILEDIYHSNKWDKAKKVNLSRYIDFFKKNTLVYTKLKNYKEALFFAEKQIKASDKLSKETVLKNIAELEKKYQSKIDKQEIQLLKDKNDIEKQKSIILLLSLLGLIVIFTFGFVFNRQRLKAIKRDAELNKLALQKEKLITEKLNAEKEVSNLELELKERELASKSIYLLQKKEQYETIAKQLKELKPHIDETEEAKKILNAITSNHISSKSSFNWEEFKLTFEKVHTNFFENLLAKHPNLSANEKKICTFLKLGFNTKDISAITQQANRTIVVARSRLRKKLNLTKEDNLASYIASF